MILSCWFLQQSDLFLIIRDHNLIQFSIIIKLILFSSKTNHDIIFMLNDRFHVGCINQEKTAHPGENPDGKNPKQSRGYVTGQTVNSTLLKIQQSLKCPQTVSQTFMSTMESMSKQFTEPYRTLPKQPKQSNREHLLFGVRWTLRVPKLTVEDCIEESF